MIALFAPTWRHRLALKIIWLFPQIQMVALCNSRAINKMTNDEGRMTNGSAFKPTINNQQSTINSDIDLFIITKKGNLWTGRLIATVVTSFLGVRRRNTHGLEKGSMEYIRRTRDKYCLSFFITEEHLNLDDIRLQPEDPYLDLWTETLVPIIDKNGTFERFLGINKVQNTKYKIQNSESLFYKNPAFIIYYLLFIISLFESLIKYLWLPRTLRTYEKLGRPWGIVISDTMLKFHDQDMRRFFLEKNL